MFPDLLGTLSIQHIDNCAKYVALWKKISVVKLTVTAKEHFGKKRPNTKLKILS